MVSLGNDDICQRDAVPCKVLNNRGDDGNGVSTFWSDFLRVRVYHQDKTHIIFVRVYTLCIKPVTTVSLFLCCTETDPDVSVESENDVDAGRAARRREMVKV